MLLQDLQLGINIQEKCALKKAVFKICEKQKRNAETTWYDNIQHSYEYTKFYNISRCIVEKSVRTSIIMFINFDLSHFLFLMLFFSNVQYLKN